MDMNHFVPAGGGLLRRSVLHNGQTIASFTETRTVHPDTIWHPLGGEFEQGHGMPHMAASFGQGDATQQEEKPGQTGDTFDLKATGRQIRSALRPGAV